MAVDVLDKGANEDDDCAATDTEVVDEPVRDEREVDSAPVSRAAPDDVSVRAPRAFVAVPVTDTPPVDEVVAGARVELSWAWIRAVVVAVIVAAARAWLRVPVAARAMTIPVDEPVRAVRLAATVPTIASTPVDEQVAEPRPCATVAST